MWEPRLDLDPFTRDDRAVRERISTLSGDVLYGAYAPALVDEVLAALTPQKLLLVVSIKDDGEGAATLRILPEVHAEVLDSQRRPTPLGAVGRLHVKGCALFRGYWTAAGVDYRPGDLADGGLYRTGDLVKWDKGARIRFCGREAGAHVKVRGFKLFPEAIEAEILQRRVIRCAAAL